MAGGKRLYRLRRCQAELRRGVVSADPWAQSWALADLPLAASCCRREMLWGLRKGKYTPAKAGVRGCGAREVQGEGRVPCVPARGPACRTGQGGHALHRRDSRRGVGARPREALGCASSPGNQADTDSLGFLSAAQIGASLSQQTQSVTVTAERCLRDAVDVQGMDCSHLSGEQRTRLCRGGREGGRAAPRRSSPSFLCRAPGWWRGALVPGWQPGQSRRAAAGSSGAPESVGTASSELLPKPVWECIPDPESVP